MMISHMEGAFYCFHGGLLVCDVSDHKVTVILTSFCVNRPYALKKTPVKYPYYSPSLVLENTYKSRNPPSENHYFSTFQIPLKNIDFQAGNSLF